MLDITELPNAVTPAHNVAKNSVKDAHGSFGGKGMSCGGKAKNNDISNGKNLIKLFYLEQSTQKPTEKLRAISF